MAIGRGGDRIGAVSLIIGRRGKTRSVTLRIYLDANVYNRPFDDQGQGRIRSETLILRVVLRLVEFGELELVNSYILEYENSRNPFPNRQQWVESRLQLATLYQEETEEIVERGRELQQEGLGIIDALHVACAEAAGSDYLVSGDDRLIRRYRGLLNVVDTRIFLVALIGR